MVPTVLIVDDERHTREGLQQALEDNFDVSVAGSADEAFNLMEAETYDVIVTDLRMPGKSGLKVIDKAHGIEMKPILKKRIDRGSTLVTDGFGGYHGLSEHFKDHVILNRSKKIRVIGPYHTNTIEGFWSMLKRAIVGQYHRLTSVHLQTYLDEIAFKYNHRNSTNTFEHLLKRCLSPPCAIC